MSDSDLSVGWIGTGRMGAAMAARLARAGRGPHASGTAPGPRPSRSPTRAPRSPTRSPSSRDRDVVFTMVSTPADLEQVLLGEGGLLADPRAPPGAVVDCSTVSTEASARDARRVRRARGVDFLAAPVSGNGKVVAAGKLSLVVLRSARRPTTRSSRCSSHLGRRVTYVGEGDARPAGEDLPQPHARRGRPDTWPRSPCWPRRAACPGRRSSSSSTTA